MKKLTVGLLTVILTALSLNAAVFADVGAYARNIPAYENPKGIIITQPPDFTVTSSSKISIFGACDFEFPLYINGAEIKTTERGFFAHYVTLADGENKVSLKNGDKEKTITITKSSFTEITYTEPKYGVINRNYVSHRAKPDEDVNLLTPLMPGTTFKVLGEAEDYYKIEGGTYVYKVSIDLFDGKLPANVISSVKASDMGNVTGVKYAMNVNALYDISVTENKARVVIHASEDKSTTLDTKGTRITAATKSFADGKAAYELTFAEKPIGYYVEFKDGEMLAGFIFANKTGSLSGKTIVLDAGHGGAEPGALGPLNSLGAVEKDFNLYVTLAAAEYLEAKGASVLLTRPGDKTAELADRVSFILDKKPDISVSVHSNSRPVTQDYNGASGALIYYSFDTGLEAAKSLLKSVTESLDMKYTPPFKENFAITRITNCPAVLLEMSFMSNPSDYEWLSKPENLEKMGKAIGEAVEGYLKKY